MARITSEFTAQILEALREASLEELSARRKSQPRAVAKKKRSTKAAPAPKVKVARPSKVEKPKARRAPDAGLTRTATSFFAERGRKGATADQLTAHFAEHGLAEQGEAVLEELARAGVVRDAGFRRSTGTGHRTMAVYVSAR
jgi:hypothetical protein